MVAPAFMFVTEIAVAASLNLKPMRVTFWPLVRFSMLRSVPLLGPSMMPLDHFLDGV